MAALSFIVTGIVIGISIAAPDSLPSPVNNWGAAYGIMVSEEQRTCLEVNVVYCEECSPHPGHVMSLYYTQLGGWFQSTKRVLLFTQMGFNDSDRVHFEKASSSFLAPVRIRIPNDVSGKGKCDFIFTPAASFKDPQSMQQIKQLGQAVD